MIPFTRICGINYNTGTWTGDSPYCSISFNSAGRVMRDAPAEILVSAWCQNRRDKKKIRQPCALTNLGTY